MKKRQTQRDELLLIPGVGKRVAEDFRKLGVKSISDLKGKDPEKLYADLERITGTHVDRCMLYVMRCAVYFAEAPRDPKDPMLLWWNWKDSGAKQGRGR